jgi:hypothetical protein
MKVKKIDVEEKSITISDLTKGEIDRITRNLVQRFGNGVEIKADYKNGILVATLK